MSIRFLPLASLSVSHDYYGGACGDFDYLLPSDSTALLRAGRLLARTQDARLHLLFEAWDDDTPVSPLPGQVLRIGLRLNNPYFDNFSVPPLAPARRLAVYANSGNPAALAAPLAAQPVGGLFVAQPQLAKRPVTLRLRDAAAQTLAEQTLAGSGEASAFDLRTLPAGRYALEEDYADEQQTTPLYRHPELAEAGLYGVVELSIDAGFYATPPAFAIHFAARTQTLKYYVVADRYGPGEFSQLNVADHGFDEDGRAEVKFDKLASDIEPALLGGTPGNTLLFQSQSPISRSRRGLRKLQLARGNTILVEHLPQPGAERAQAQHIIHLSKP